MATIKITQTEKKEIEIEVQFPVFRKHKNNSMFYKVYSEEKCISVTYSQYLDSEIKISSMSLAYFMGDDIQDCAESEFLDAYNQVKQELDKLATE